MILAADTPNYIPGLEFFLKMSQADCFVLDDTRRFSGQGVVSRTAIKGPAGPQWLTVPVLQKQQQSIRDVQIDRQRHWRQKHFKTLQVNYAYAPYFEYFSDFFAGIYEREWQYLLDLNMAIIEFLREALRIETSLPRVSGFQLGDNVTSQTIDLCRQTGCTSYLTSEAVAGLLNDSQISSAGLQTRLFRVDLPQYRQQFEGFYSGLSVIDLLFNEGPEALWIIAGILS